MTVIVAFTVYYIYRFQYNILKVHIKLQQALSLLKLCTSRVSFIVYLHYNPHTSIGVRSLLHTNLIKSTRGLLRQIHRPNSPVISSRESSGRPVKLPVDDKAGDTEGIRNPPTSSNLGTFAGGGAAKSAIDENSIRFLTGVGPLSPNADKFAGLIDFRDRSATIAPPP